MPRPERPIDPASGPLQRFAHDLRVLRRQAGNPTYRQLARTACYSASALSEAAGGERLPSLEVTLAYAQACGGDRHAWTIKWRRAAAELEAGKDKVPAVDDSPYLGLVTFQPEDSDRFFGREQLVSELVSRLAEVRFLAVFGASGSGKSSVLRAGLIPALRAGGLPGSTDWPTVLMTPGEHPLEELAVQLAVVLDVAASSLHQQMTADPGALDLFVRQAMVSRPYGSRVVLVIDQFEEVFTLCRASEERTAFIDALLTAALSAKSRAGVLLGVRADFYPHCGSHALLASALTGRQVLVGSMGPEDLRKAIVGPANACAVKVEPELVAAVVSDVSGEPGGLPLLSHALLETWRRRQGRRLGLGSYRAAGGVRGAIAQTAEHVYERFDTRQQPLARRIFLGLTALGDGATPDTRRRLSRDELGTAERDDVAVVLDQLAVARLVVLGAETVEIAHEALIQAWPRLQRWLTEDRDSLRTHRQLGDAARIWASVSRDPGSLYRGARLAVAREWADLGGRADLSTLESAFLNASTELELSERVAAQRRTRRLRRLAAGLAILVLVAAIAVVTAVRQRHDALAATRTAVSRQLAANAALLADSQPALARLLSVEAFRVSPTVEARSSLLSIAGYQGYSTLAGHTGGVKTIAFTPDGRVLASAGSDQAIALWDTSSHDRVATLYGHRDSIRALAVSPDGRVLASGGRDNPVQLWDLNRRQPLGSLAAIADVHSLAFSPDGRVLAAAGDDGAVLLWDVARRHGLIPLRGHTGPVNGVAISPDGRNLASAGADGKVLLWNLTGRGEPSTLTGHRGQVNGVAFSPDGRSLASGGDDRKVLLRDMARPDLYTVLTGHTDWVRNVAFSADGRTLASASSDRTVVFWDVPRRSRLTTLTGHTDAVRDVAFSPRGGLFASGSTDETILLRNPAVPPFTGHTDWVSDVAFSPDGHTVLTASRDRSIVLWDLVYGTRQGVLAGHTEAVNTIAVSPDGQVIASAGRDRRIRLWRTADRTLLGSLAGHSAAVNALVFSPDGATLASADRDGHLLLWDIHSRIQSGTLPSPAQSLNELAFSPNGRMLAAAVHDRTVILWDLYAGTSHTLRGHTAAGRAVAFSPDGRTLASAGGEVIVWDIATLRPRTVLTGNTTTVRAVAFSPGGRALATAGGDRSVVLWNLPAGTTQAILNGHTAQIEDVEFSPDGQTLVSAGKDHRIIAWSLNVRHVVATICAAAPRNLHPDEWRQLAPGLPYHPTCHPTGRTDPSPPRPTT